MHDLVWINWTGPNVSPEESVVVQHAVAKYLRDGVRSRSIFFSHRSCEGVLTREGEGLYGTIAGYFFSVDMGEYEKGKRRLMKCLMRRNEEAHLFESPEPVRLTRLALSGSKRGQVTEHEIKPPREDSIRLHRPN